VGPDVEHAAVAKVEPDGGAAECQTCPRPAPPEPRPRTAGFDGQVVFAAGGDFGVPRIEDPKHRPVVILTSSNLRGCKVGPLEFDDEPAGCLDVGTVRADGHFGPAGRESAFPRAVPVGFFAPRVAVGQGSVGPMVDDDVAAFGDEGGVTDSAVSDGVGGGGDSFVVAGSGSGVEHGASVV